MPETTVVTTEQRVLNIPVTVKELVEAIIFASSDPLTVKQLKNILAESGQSAELNVESVVDTINEEYQQANKPYRIVRIAGGYQYSTVPEYAEWVGKLYKEQGKRKLSQSSLETLAIIAYRQPITRPDIEAIRGVDCDYVLGTLLEKKLVTITGRAPTPGRPLLYGTTEVFLKHFGLNDISDLPKPREIEELLADSRYETERRMLEAQEQADAERKKQEEEDFKSRLPHIPKKKAEMDGAVEIVPKKQSRELGVKKDGEMDESIEDAASQLTSETLDTQQLEPIQEKGLEESIESTSDIQLSDIPSVDMPVNLSPIEMNEEGATELSEEPEIEVQDRAPETAEEPQAPVIEMSTPDTEARITEDLIPEEEETEEFIEEQVIPGEVSDIQENRVEKEQVEEAPTESEQTTVQDDEQPTHSVTAEAAQEAALEAVPPFVAPIDDEVREPAKPKSRWQLLKETVQGFLKKVFG
ncbi:MAG: SMC-Scp complex subunit ScpB [Ignavibacteriae bacterium]|nr:SMC-Scp complex subunit ScpB [Ignavibacteriota bacterium]